MGNLQEELNELEQKRKDLKEKILKEKEYKKANKDKIKADRDAEIERVDGVLRDVLSEVYAFNKLGKVAKMEADVLGKIHSMTAPQDKPEEPEPGPEGDVDEDESA